MDLDVRERTAVVTGGSSGIGLACVTRLLAEGANVVTCARDRERLDAAIAPLDAQYPAQLSWQTADVRTGQEVDDLINAGVKKFGAIDMIVNNAGQSLSSNFDSTTDADWMSEFQLKFFGVINVLRAARPWLTQSEVASVVNINAVLARQPNANLIATSATRAGLLNLSKSLSVDFSDDNIRVNSVCVGVIDTGQMRRRYRAAESELSFDQWYEQLSLNLGTNIPRLGRPEEVAAAVAFLLSPLSGYTTGAVLDVAGGIGRYV
ncbi:NAD(P)-dependent dehydrogenase (short-subunit alcohol dehydrogenase family) [Rhodoglobus vestalii]|uniref:NAD(P)-dependent dehydrogenase (Short-subunit alcohol dehydrogenase family) n=1 Tax=Rhodoglobus vestalii TaxID=193384 RepID=A0A8H2PY74_9MICO|nr:SDR family oxidoreductase [Rhodoglobus vestalii]TQO20064.1 NAD(P)-dependent dehydrogenase (short-subunit alcohol dehydrogenase family) [Rhodoglobus vestalii]